MRGSWTDERLDYLNHRVDDGFKQVDQRFKQVDERFRQVDERFDRVERDLRELRAEMTVGFATTQRMVIQVGGGVIATVLVGILSAIVAMA